MNLHKLLFVIAGTVMFTGVIFLMRQIYRLAVIDAQSRGLKHPKFWGLFTLSGQRGERLLLYLIFRHRYPVINMSEEVSLEMQRRKKAAGLSIALISIGAIAIILIVKFYNL